MAAVKKTLELDTRIESIVREEYADFEHYLPTAQDKAMYRRKQKEYWDKINARLREGVIDGRADNE
ncbi:MAG: hypothetical protein IJS39_06180 [Synergistaceae bacterium]|nr:hypothetical protein [Synergistaceae bacterium]